MGSFETGYLELFIGPMFSGKSTKLCHELSFYADIGMTVLYVNSLDDTRTLGEEKVSTHNSSYTGLSPKITALKSKTLREVDVTDYAVIGIDESQFFEDLIDVVEEWVTQKHKVVYCAGLDGDRFRKQFGYTLQLIPLANWVTKFNAKCHICLTANTPVSPPGPRGRRLANMTITDAPFTAGLSTSKTQKLIGGADTYAPMCRYHFEQHMNLTS
jgi:thymidine kinase